MGSADLVPGFSGGTVAFLSGIYEELIYSIKLLSGDFLRLLLQFKIKEAISIIPFRFLVPLALGLFTAVLTLAQVLSYLLQEHPVYVWAFVFGLVLASTLIVLKRVKKITLKHKILFAIAAIIMYFASGLIPIETPMSIPFLFVSGALAICAMILPGVSGTFILLLLGKYQQILAAVTNRDLLTLGVFMIGCIVGLAVFVRILSWLFKNYHDISIVILAGLMLGSLRKIWPWRETVLTRINSHGVEVPILDKNIFPSSIDGSVISAVALIVFGVVLVLYLDKLQVTKEHVSDVDNPQFKKEHAKISK